MAARNAPSPALILHPGAALAAADLPRCVLVCAPSPLGDEAIAELVTAIAAGGAGVLRGTLDGAEVTPPVLHAELGTASLNFGDVRLMVLRDAQELTAEAQTTLAALLPRVPDGTLLLLWVTHAAAPKWGKALAQAAEQSARRFEVAAPSRDLASWVRGRAHRYGGRLTTEAAQWLVNSVGDNLLQLDQEAQKLALLSAGGGGGDITAAVVDASVTPSATASVFRLIDAVGAAERDRALTRLHELRSRGNESAIGFVALLGRHFRFLWQARVLSEAGWRGDAGLFPPGALPLLPGRGPISLAEFLKRQRWLGRQFHAQAQRFTMAQLTRVIPRLLAADLALKRGPSDAGEDAILQELVLDLCGLPGK